MAAPTLKLSHYMGCPIAFDRKMALYFIAPFGLAATATSYPQHGNDGVLACNLAGIASVMLAVTWGPMMVYRQVFMVGGCLVMLGAQFSANSIAKEKAVTETCGGGHVHHQG